MRRRGWIGVAWLALALAAPTQARAADLAALPLEPGATVLDGEAVGAVVVDIDADGAAELVRLVTSEANPAVLAVDAWVVDDNGRWTQLGAAALHRKASVDRQLSGTPRPDAEGMLPVLATEPARLLTVRAHEGDVHREHAMVAVIGTQGEDAPCCLTLWEVVVAGDTIRLDLVADTGRGAEFVTVADLNTPDDPDSADEILVGSQQPDGSAELRIFGLADGSLVEIARRSYPQGSALLTWEARSLGRYTDGCRGGRPAEVAVVEPGREVPDGSFRQRLTVLSMTGSELGETASDAAWDGGFTVAVRDDGVPMVYADERPWFSWPWPEQIFPPVSDRRAIGGSSEAPLLLVEVPQRSAEFSIADECGAPLLSASMSEATGVFPDSVLSGLRPYIGQPTRSFTDGGSLGAVIGGRRLAFGLDGIAISEVATLPGMSIIGPLGPRDSWVALAESPAFPVSHRGLAVSLYEAPFPARTTVTPLDQLLTPEADAGALPVELAGAVPVPDGLPDELLTAASGFLARVEVPRGSRLFVAPLGPGFAIQPSWQGRSADGHAEIPVAVPDGRSSFNVRAFVVTPSGHGYGVAWHVTVVEQPPALAVGADWAPFGFEVPIRGTTDPRAAVLVNGEPVAVAADGTFAVSVGAPPWPTRVEVEAVDLVGNRTTTTLSVVGLLDYRQLPWVPIIVGLTITAAVALFLLAPRLRPPPPSPHDGDGAGTFEEIEER